FRWPSATPNFSRSVSVTSGRTSRSMAFSAKAVAYWASPIPSSQVSIWSLSLTVACAHQRYCYIFPLSSLHILLCARAASGHATAAQQFLPSDGDCHTPLPCEVRKGNDTTPQECSLPVQGGQDPGTTGDFGAEVTQRSIIRLGSFQA